MSKDTLFNIGRTHQFHNLDIEGLKTLFNQATKEDGFNLDADTFAGYLGSIVKDCVTHAPIWQKDRTRLEFLTALLTHIVETYKTQITLSQEDAAHLHGICVVEGYPVMKDKLEEAFPHYNLGQ
jgi:hypothetical protein